MVAQDIIRNVIERLFQIYKSQDQTMIEKESVESLQGPSA